MSEAGVERRLTTILAADVVGYSRLMEADEAGTLAALKAHRSELIEPKAADFHGRVVKLMGDGILMEFASVVDALAFAVEVQRAMAERNADVPEDRRIQFRIGVNIGDIIVEGDDIYGDGVNIASRLEGLAEPGGICLSRQALDQVEGKLAFEYEDLGQQDLKNIERPVRVYRVHLDPDAAQTTAAVKRPTKRRWGWVAAAAVIVVAIAGGTIWTAGMREAEPPSDTAAQTAEARIAIAVLPFVNRSADPEQDYFADGLTEDLITDLTKFREMRVAARTSTSAYKGKALDLREVGKELGVQYLVEGSVEKGGDKVRVTAQLIDAATGGHIWAERYDRELTDIFAIRDEIRTAIVGAMTGSTGPLLKAEMEKAERQSPDSVRARDLFYRALARFPDFNKEANAEARDLLKRSIELDPNDAAAYALLAWTHWRDVWVDWGDDPAASRDLAVEAAKKAVAHDGANYRGHWALAAALRLHGDSEAAAANYDRAFELNPHDPDMLADWGEFLRDNGEVEEAIVQLKRAMELNPHYPDWYLNILTSAYSRLGRYEEAVRTANMISNPSIGIRENLAVGYVHLGRMEEAREEVAMILEIDPLHSVSIVLAWPGWKRVDPQVVESYADALRQAGLPE